MQKISPAHTYKSCVPSRKPYASLSHSSSLCLPSGFLLVKSADHSLFPLSLSPHPLMMTISRFATMEEREERERERGERGESSLHLPHVQRRQRLPSPIHYIFMHTHNAIHIRRRNISLILTSSSSASKWMFPLSPCIIYYCVCVSGNARPDVR